MDLLSLVIAVGAGVISFLSPCVLPLVPGYISFVSGSSLSDLAGKAGAPPDAETRVRRQQVVLNTLVFVIGFSIVFVGMGASATYAGQWLAGNRLILSKIAGIGIILFGLHTIGILRIGFLSMEKRIHANRKPLGLLGSFGIGLAFAFGWSPCIGPILASVLLLAADRETVGEGVVLLSAYSAGLGVPFLLTGLAVNRFLAVSQKIKRHMRKVEITAGILLLLMGVLVFTDSLQVLARYLTFLPILG